MASLDKTPQEELKEKAWQAATRVALAVTLLGGGYTIGYLQFGDAIQLRTEVKQKKDRIVDLENERETMSTKMAKVSRDKDVCEKAAKASAAAAPVPAATAPAAAPAPAPAN